MQEPQHPQYLLSSDLISVEDVCRIVPPRKGKRLHASTVLRWGRQGRIALYWCNGYRVSLTEIRAKFGVRKV